MRRPVKIQSPTPLEWAFLHDRLDLVEVVSDESWRRWELRHNWTLGTCAPAAEELWRLWGDRVLKAWINDNPGTRPSCWWHFDAPNELRRRLGGTGMLMSDCTAQVPTTWGGLGIPTGWLMAGTARVLAGLDPEHERVTRSLDCRGPRPFAGVPVDPKDPPIFEAQATYLDRHGLMTAAERRRLPPDAFEPEAISFAP